MKLLLQAFALVLVIAGLALIVNLDGEMREMTAKLQLPSESSTEDDEPEPRTEVIVLTPSREEVSVQPPEVARTETETESCKQRQDEITELRVALNREKLRSEQLLRTLKNVVDSRTDLRGLPVGIQDRYLLECVVQGHEVSEQGAFSSYLQLLDSQLANLELPESRITEIRAELDFSRCELIRPIIEKYETEFVALRAKRATATGDELQQIRTKFSEGLRARDYELRSYLPQELWTN